MLAIAVGLFLTNESASPAWTGRVWPLTAVVSYVFHVTLAVGDVNSTIGEMIATYNCALLGVMLQLASQRS